MRTWILALMIALLPLRGWVSEVMASQPPTDRPSSVAMVLEPTMDCHLHDGAVHQPRTMPDAAADVATPDSGMCHSCQVCHSVAVEPDGFAAKLPRLRHAQPGTAPVRFASADLAPGVEPPIS